MKLSYRRFAVKGVWELNEFKKAVRHTVGEVVRVASELERGAYRERQRLLVTVY